ncbi:hypothetical protein [Mycobacterium sp.]|uniref:hypothetical protein n=1 Tax=Mycobacterium sp. TaxID=1785 RepID=UPI003D102440
MNPANASWDIPWDGHVDVGTGYTLLVRVRNTDSSVRAAPLHLDGWVSDYTAGGVGPGSAILDSSHNPVQFSGADDATDLQPGNVLVLTGAPMWTPTVSQTNINGGHVCVAVNVYNDPTANAPADGGPVVSGFLDPTCDRRYGQRNVQIVTVGAGQQIRFPFMVAATRERPLDARVEVLRAELREGADGALQRVPVLEQAARIHALTELRRPDGDPLAHLDIVHEREGRGNHTSVHVEPGARAHLYVTLEAKGQKPGEAYAFDIVTTDIKANVRYGAARVYVLVTGKPR